MHEGCLSGDEETVDKSIISLLIFSFLGCFSATEKQQQSCNSNFNFIEVIFYIEHAAAAFIQCQKNSGQKVFRTFFLIFFILWLLLESQRRDGLFLAQFWILQGSNSCCIMFMLSILLRITFRIGALNHLCVPLFIASLPWLLCRDPQLFYHFIFHCLINSLWSCGISWVLACLCE